MGSLSEEWGNLSEGTSIPERGWQLQRESMRPSERDGDFRDGMETSERGWSLQRGSGSLEGGWGFQEGDRDLHLILAKRPRSDGDGDLITELQRRRRGFREGLRERMWASKWGWECSERDGSSKKR